MLPIHPAPAMRALLGAPPDPDAQLRDGPIASAPAPAAAAPPAAVAGTPSPTVTPNYHPAAPPTHQAAEPPPPGPPVQVGGSDPVQPWTESPVTPAGPDLGAPQQVKSGDPGQPAAPVQTPAQAAQAAKDAAFARQKDHIGQTMRASMTALRENLAGRGALDGGLESGGMASLLGQGDDQLSNVVSNQAAFDVAGNNATANRNYQGEIQKRGQDMGMTASMLSLLGSQAY